MLYILASAMKLLYTVAYKLNAANWMQMLNNNWANKSFKIAKLQKIKKRLR